VLRSLCVMLLLGFVLPVQGDDPAPMKSIFLVARKDLPDPFFRDSVVLVTNYGGIAPVGVIINRRTQVTLASAFPDIDRLRSREDKLFFGGPVQPDMLVGVFRAAARPADAFEVIDGVYMSSSYETLRALLGRDTPLDGVRVFAGHAGWGPGQLESEIARNDWYLIRADAKTIFEKKPEGLWKELERQGSALMVLRSTALDPGERTASHP
jgi:putative transcriptional regulator